MRIFKVLFLSVVLALGLSAEENYDVNNDRPLQRQALIKFYDSTNGDSWQDKDNWKDSNVSYCEWYGVTCDVITVPDTNPAIKINIVTEIDLYQNNLTGTIPKEIGNLVNLTHIMLVDNNIGGTIPKEIKNLVNLTKLNFGGNNLSGSIPPEIGQLENLNELYLWENSLTGTIPKEIKNLVNLTYLTFSDNNLSGSIPPEIGQLVNLKRLYLRFNKLTGNIPKEIGHLTNLDYLDLMKNNLTGNIPQEITQLEELEYRGGLRLHFNCSLKSDNEEVINFIKYKGLNDYETGEDHYEIILKTSGHCQNMSPIYYLLMN